MSKRMTGAERGALEAATDRASGKQPMPDDLPLETNERWAAKRLAAAFARIDALAKLELAARNLSEAWKTTARPFELERDLRAAIEDVDDARRRADAVEAEAP